MQVTWSLKNEQTRNREIRALREAGKEMKNCRKQIVTLNEETTLDDGDIKVLPLWQFLEL